jgi:hypothetical protein
MMRSLLLAGLAVFSLLIAGSAQAQSIRVQAGEHEGFTRLVLTLKAPADWRLSRTSEGYELQFAGPPAPFDLSEVFRIIPKTRLVAIWSDPANGRLRLRIGCACHAIPFEFRPEILVIDLRDGPPEPGSSFELAEDGSEMSPLAAPLSARLRPRPAPVRGTANLQPVARPARAPRPRPSLMLPTVAQQGIPLPGIPTPQAPLPQASMPTGAPQPPELTAMRKILVEELARAASEGVIETDAPVFPEPPDGTVPEALPTGAAAHLSIGDLPGLTARPVNEPPAAMTADGDACLPDDAFDIASWSDGRTFAEQVAAARSGLLGEFDRPDPEHVATLVRLMLYFGFGAEARNLLDNFPVEPEDAALWSAMADIMDNGAAARGSALGDQLPCPGPAALWASLALAALPQGERIDAAAVALAFSMLPVHLRRHLGPGLAEKFLSAGDVATAQRLRDAIWRAPGDAGPEAELFDGRLARERGNLEEAETAFAAVSRDGGPAAARALIDLVNARLALGETIDFDTVTEVAARRHEHKGDALEPALLRAETLARASSGDYGTAFPMATDAGPETLRDLWALLAKSGADEAVLTYAVVGSAADLPPVDGLTAERIGSRLLDLGFPDEALLWLPRDNVVLVGRSELMRGDARAALRAIAGETGPVAEQLRAEALARLGDQAAAASAYAAAGDDAARTEALWRAEDWNAAAPAAPDPRRLVTDLLIPKAAKPGTGPLAQGQALIEDSAATRAAILSMLETLPDPAGAAP